MILLIAVLLGRIFHESPAATTIQETSGLGVCHNALQMSFRMSPPKATESRNPANCLEVIGSLVPRLHEGVVWIPTRAPLRGTCPDDNLRRRLLLE
jgi:hypothetical protein